MNTKAIISIIFIIFMAGCSSDNVFKKINPFKKEEASLEPQQGGQPASIEKSENIFVCAGDIDVAYKKLGEVSLGEFGFSGNDILAKKIREKASAVGAQGVINVQYDTGASKTWKGYGELGGTDYGIKYTSWCNGIAIVYMEEHNSLGLLFCNITRENKDWFKFKKSQTGAIVVHVLPGSIAEGAGIRVEDLIMEWNGEKIERKNQIRHLTETTAGKDAKLTILHGGEIRTVTVSVPVNARAQVVASPPKPIIQEKQIPVVPVVPAEASSATMSLKSADVHNEVGDLYLRKGMYDDAMEEYKKAVAVDPNCALAHFNLSIIYDRKGMKREADEEFAVYKRLKSQRR
jgi:tetratricopeptide (TPR) repeat protein